MTAKDDNLSLYSEYNKTLRTWLVGFGFGVPALFIINEVARKKLTGSCEAEFIIWLFLIGAGSQIFMAFLNKIVSWCAYYKHDNKDKAVHIVIRGFAALENYFIIDVFLDVLSIVTFGWSIFLIMGIFLY